MYQALYRKWRPKTFDDVVGQQHITETLKNQVSTGRLSHAYLFIGTRGTGKTTCAKILAKAVNCEHPVNGNPCNQCQACLGIDDGSVMDVVEIDAASNNGVDNVRALRDEAIFSPAMVKKRVYIIDEVHMLSASAFNALLKILEEPPAHLMFILATTELHKVPATILSRCQRHSFKRLDMPSLVGRLRYVAGQEGLTLTDDAAALIARLSEGGMRDALSLLDQCSGRSTIDVDTVYSAMGLAGKQYTAQMLRFLAEGQTPQALELFQKLWQDGKDPATLLGELSSLLRDILMTQVAPKGSGELLSSGYDDQVLASFTGSFTAGRLINSINTIQETLGNMRNGQAKTLCELCLIQLAEPELGEGLPQLRERVARLEAQLAGGVRPAAAAQPPMSPAAFAEKAPPPAPPMRTPEKAAPWPDPTPSEEPPFDLEPPPEPRFVPSPAPPPPAPEQEAETAPSPAAPSAGAWDAVLAALRGKLPMGIYAMLSDPLKASGAVSGDALTLFVEPGFAMNNVNRPDVVSRVAAAAAAVLGRPVQVAVQPLGQQEPETVKAAVPAPKSNIDELSRFEIVSFK